MSSSVFGLFAGSCAMSLAASIVLAYRAARSRFTIGAILFVIAVIAVLLALGRGLFS